MKTITRQAPLPCLAQQPANQDWYAFMKTPCHSTTHQALHNEQQGLCCYCESELTASNGHLEHMEPRSRNAGRTYDYANLAISCNGSGSQHCGHYKDSGVKKTGYEWNSGSFSPPHAPATEQLFKYDLLGGISPTDVDPVKAEYMIGYLGLDCAQLTERRAAQARDLVDTLGETPDPAIVQWLKADYLGPSANGHLKQFHSLSKAILEP